VPIRDEEGRVIGTFGISRDVDEEKQLEDKLQHVRDYLETLIEKANDMIYTVDTQGRFTFANERAAQVTGIPSD
jgi:PAS domain-containing protein